MKTEHQGVSFKIDDSVVNDIKFNEQEFVGFINHKIYKWAAVRYLKINDVMDITLTVKEHVSGDIVASAVIGMGNEDVYV